MPDKDKAVQPPAGAEDAACCCGPRNHEIKNFRPVKTGGSVSTASGDIAVVTGSWSLEDYFGQVMVRLGFFRMDYAVKPALYAIGKPGPDSPVFVSANYKLSFDILRRGLAGIDGWILVLDTKGVNVWCAAGKGTFGTKEIVARIIETGLGEVVSHRDLIVPQLGAPGVSAFRVMLFSGFRVIYGPVRSADIAEFMRNGGKASGKMREVSFDLRDRLVVSLLELTMALEKLLPAALVLICVYALSAGRFSFKAGLEMSLFPLSALLTAVLTGTVLCAALLPYLPGKAFSLKGGILGFLVSSGIMFLTYGQRALSLRALSFVLFVSALSAYLALNFTGSSTFTSLPGVKKEVRLSLPMIAGVLLVSLITFAVKGR